MSTNLSWISAARTGAAESGAALKNVVRCMNLLDMDGMAARRIRRLNVGLRRERRTSLIAVRLLLSRACEVVRADLRVQQV